MLDIWIVEGGIDNHCLWRVEFNLATGMGGPGEDTGIRPVITLKQGILKEAIESDSSKDGSLSNPYVIK